MSKLKSFGQYALTSLFLLNFSIQGNCQFRYIPQSNVSSYTIPHPVFEPSIKKNRWRAIKKPSNKNISSKYRRELSDGGYEEKTCYASGTTSYKTVHPCMLCHGAKHCTLCNGTGVRYTPSGYTFACKCGGSNICTGCLGQGNHISTYSINANGQINSQSMPLNRMPYTDRSTMKCPRCKGTGYYKWNGDMIPDFGAPSYKECRNCGNKIKTTTSHMCKCRTCGGTGEVKR